ncbi:single-stranded-DNA-specific exonuclease RecJ [Patescibacteria group bacterium]|nr:single-stranded-DNA-specific exonuclease RecJ [Patescibacteria group bacterium]
MDRKWDVVGKIINHKSQITNKEVIRILLNNRGLKTTRVTAAFLSPLNPSRLTAKDVDIDARVLAGAMRRIEKAIQNKESIVVYADYDADGITAGAVMWETLHSLGARVMPYIPHRVEEGYGLSIKGLDSVIENFRPTLIITVDHGITAREKVAYAKEKGIDVIVTDHHVKPKTLPECTIVHTTKLSGAGVSWFVCHELLQGQTLKEKGLTLTSDKEFTDELLALSAIGTIADLLPLTGPNRSIAKFGLEALRSIRRVGLAALISEAGLDQKSIGTYEISHMIAPRLNAAGRIEHALDALRLLCTHNAEKSELLAKKLGLTNRERQQMTMDTTLHARGLVPKTLRKLIFVAHGEYNQGIIGLVAGRLTEEYWRPAVVVSRGELVSKASARSIPGFNIIESIRQCSDILVDAGGHPMAAGFTIETKNLELLKKRLTDIAERTIDEDMLRRTLRIDMEIPLSLVTPELWQELQALAPFGFGNPEPVFVSKKVKVLDTRLVGNDGKHLKLRLSSDDVTMKQLSNVSFDAIAFSFGSLYGKLEPGQQIDVAYTIDMNVWNGSRKLQLKIKDIHY